MSDYQGIRVQVEDVATGENDLALIFNDYVLTTAGDCRVTYTQVSRAADGSQTHVITIKGIRRGAAS